MLKVISILIVIAILVPILGGVSLPQNFSAEEIGNFIDAVIEYWRSLITQLRSANSAKESSQRVILGETFMDSLCIQRG